MKTRLAEPCSCKPFERRAMGYLFYIYEGGLRPWRPTLAPAKLDDILSHAARFERIRVVCDDCHKLVIDE